VNRALTQTLKSMMEKHLLEQVVTFYMLSRTVNNQFRSSKIDHVYVNDHGKIKAIT
jgi:transposase-like protein